MKIKFNYFVLNLSATLLSFLISTIISFWMTPNIINTIGQDAYGFIPLVQNSINYIIIITIAFTSMVGRFFTYEIKKNNKKDAEEYLVTSFFAMIILGIVIIILVILGTIFIEKLINIPARLIVDVKILVLIQGITFVISTISTVFAVAPFCTNKLFYNNIVSVIQNAIRAIIIFIMLKLAVPKLWYVGFGGFVAQIISIYISLVVFRRLMPNIRFKIKYFKIEKLTEILKYGIWNSFNQLGSMLYLQTDLLMANLRLGPIIAGQYSTILMCFSMIRNIGNLISSIFTPRYVELYAKNNMKEIVNYSNKAIFIEGVLLSFFIGGLGGLGQSFMRVWLGSEFEMYKYILLIMGINLALNISISPLFGLLSTVKQVKIPAIIQILIGVINIILIYIITGPINLGIYGIAISSLISYSLINLIFIPIYAAKVTNQKLTSYYTGIIRGICASIISILIFTLINNMFYIENWIQLIGSSILGVIIHAILCLCIFCDKEERGNMICKIKCTLR